MTGFKHPPEDPPMGFQSASDQRSEMELRSDLPDLPGNMRGLPLHRGFPVPHFVAWFKDDKPAVRGIGEPDFRVSYPGAISECWINKKCWVCGRSIDSNYRTFVLGPMCAVNRTSAEPPCHQDCAVFSAKGCPFLSRPNATRREAGKPENTVEPAGQMIARNPGVALCWTSRDHKSFRAPNGVLFDIGSPSRVGWFAHGREATREEVQKSIDTGLPILMEMAEEEGPGAVEELNRRVRYVERELMPSA